MIAWLIRKITCAFRDCTPRPHHVSTDDLDRKMREIPDRLDRLIENERVQYNILEDIVIKDRERHHPEQQS